MSDLLVPIGLLIHDCALCGKRGALVDNGQGVKVVVDYGWGDDCSGFPLRRPALTCGSGACPLLTLTKTELEKQR